MKQCLMLCVYLLAVMFTAGAQGTPILGVSAPSQYAIQEAGSQRVLEIALSVAVELAQ